MTDEPILIDLYGRVGQVVKRNAEYIVFTFLDKRGTNCVCMAGKNTIFYYQTELDKKKEYHLVVKLIGVTRPKYDGTTHRSNRLYVK